MAAAIASADIIALLPPWPLAIVRVPSLPHVGGLTSGPAQDPETTNLYIGNLCPTVTEETLFKEFARFGPIQSVKIMWPRSEEERMRQRLNGFVAFVKRADAAQAKDEMNETELNGFVMRIGWGKAVARPTQAITLASLQGRSASASGSAMASTGPPSGHVSPPAAFSSTTPSSNSAASAVVKAQPPRPSGPTTMVLPPTNLGQRELIDRLALFVAEEGHAFEQAIMAREESNSQYRFLFDASTPEHRYYRWKVVSLCACDTMDAWDTGSFQLEAGGPIWAPPPCSKPPTDRRAAAEHDVSLSRRSRSSSSSRSRSNSRSASCSPPRERGRSSKFDSYGGFQAGDEGDRRRGHSPDRRSPDRRGRSPDRRGRSPDRRGRSPDRRRHSPDRRGRSPDRRGRSPDRRERSPDRRERSPDRDRGGRGEAHWRERGRPIGPGPGEKELSEEERDQLEDMLRGMVIERKTIRDGMGFCIERSESALEIAQTLSEALTLDETPAPKKIARLLLLSDILHNALGAAPRASTSRSSRANARGGIPPEAYLYRAAFQKLLPDIFISLHGCLTRLDSRMSVETMKEQVVKVLYVWQVRPSGRCSMCEGGANWFCRLCHWHPLHSTCMGSPAPNKPPCYAFIRILWVCPPPPSCPLPSLQQVWAAFPLSFLTRLERTLLHGSPDGPKASNDALDSSGRHMAYGDPPADCGSDSDSNDVDGEPMYPSSQAAAARSDPAVVPESLDAAKASSSSVAPAPTAAVHAQEEALRALGLRALEAVCEANGLSSAGSRSEMLQRALAAVRAGQVLKLEVEVPQQQTLVVATRWDADDEADAPTSKEGAAPRAQCSRASPDGQSSASNATVPDEPTHCSSSSAAPTITVPITVDPDIDGEEIDGEEIDGVPLTPSALASRVSPTSESTLPKSRLRDIEVQLVAFADSLESSGRSRAWIAAEVANERRKLVAKARVELGGPMCGRGSERPNDHDTERTGRDGSSRGVHRDYDNLSRNLRDFRRSRSQESEKRERSPWRERGMGRDEGLDRGRDRERERARDAEESRGRDRYTQDERRMRRSSSSSDDSPRRGAKKSRR